MGTKKPMLFLLLLHVLHKGPLRLRHGFKTACSPSLSFRVGLDLESMGLGSGGLWALRRAQVLRLRAQPVLGLGVVVPGAWG